jgi:hypothetical protein
MRGRWRGGGIWGVRICPSHRHRRRTARVEAGSTPPVAVADGSSLPPEPAPTATITRASRRRRRSPLPSPPCQPRPTVPFVQCLRPRRRHPSSGDLARHPSPASGALPQRVAPSQGHHPILEHSCGSLFTAAAPSLRRTTVCPPSHHRLGMVAYLACNKQ